MYHYRNLAGFLFALVGRYNHDMHEEQRHSLGAYAFVAVAVIAPFAFIAIGLYGYSTLVVSLIGIIIGTASASALIICLNSLVKSPR